MSTKKDLVVLQQNQTRSSVLDRDLRCVYMIYEFFMCARTAVLYPDIQIPRLIPRYPAGGGTNGGLGGIAITMLGLLSCLWFNRVALLVVM